MQSVKAFTDWIQSSRHSLIGYSHLGLHWLDPGASLIGYSHLDLHWLDLVILAFIDWIVMWAFTNWIQSLWPSLNWSSHLILHWLNPVIQVSMDWIQSSRHSQIGSSYLDCHWLDPVIWVFTDWIQNLVCTKAQTRLHDTNQSRWYCIYPKYSDRDVWAKLRPRSKQFHQGLLCPSASMLRRHKVWITWSCPKFWVSMVRSKDVWIFSVNLGPVVQN